MPTRSEPVSSTAATSSAPPDALVGRRIHKYDIVRVIGRGGMGTVYEALNTAIGKRVAMKFVDAGTVQNKDAVARFQREAQAASAVESAHIVEIFDSGTSEDGVPYIVMELLRGEDLGHRIKRCGRLDLGEAIHVTAQILRGLHRAHKAGIIHRDLKPDNIFLVDRDDDPNFAKILDFGISKVRRSGDTPVHTLTRQGTVLGTPFYMSPEQAQAQADVDGRADLWSVGAILYECLTGRPPYTGATYEQVIVNICMNDADDVRAFNPGVPEAIAQVIARALARDREERFPDARIFLDALRAAAGGAVSSRPGTLGEDSAPGLNSSDPALSPVSASRTPGHGTGSNGRKSSRKPDAGAFDATVEFQSSPPPRRRSSPELLSTRRRAALRRRQRTFILVAVSALLGGGLSAFSVARIWTGHPPESSSAHAHETAAPPELPPPATPTTPAAITPEPLVSSAPEPPVTVTAEPDPKKSGTARPGGHVVPPPVVAPVKTAPKPVDTAPPPPPSGVAPGLKLKTD
jgi:serine/threonine-protein kinase